MTQKVADNSDAEEERRAPICHEHLSEKMAWCESMMERMMSRFGEVAEGSGCCSRDEHSETP